MTKLELGIASFTALVVFFRKTIITDTNQSMYFSFYMIRSVRTRRDLLFTTGAPVNGLQHIQIMVINTAERICDNVSAQK